MTRSRSRRKRRQQLTRSSKVSLETPEYIPCSLAIALEGEVKDFKAQLEDFKSHLEALENGEEYVSKLAGKKRPVKGSSKKRKRGGGGGSRKRQRSNKSGSDDSESEISEEEEESASDSDSNSDDEGSGSDGESADEVADDLVEEETEETLNAKIKSLEAVIKANRTNMKDPKSRKREASDQISVLQKDLSKVQKEKNAFCARKRSEVRCQVALPNLTFV